MSVEERDPHTGYLTTGHEWNGITELNTPVPHAVYFFLIVTFAFSLVYWVLMPAWPLGRTYTKGLLGADQREAVLASLKQGTLDRSVWTSRIQRESFAQIQADPGLMNVVRQTAPAIFGDNCAACHGRDGKGSAIFPPLAGNANITQVRADTIVRMVLAGGKGSYWGTMAGALVLTLLTSLLTASQLPEAVRQIVLGVTLLALLSVYGRQRGLRQ